MRKFKKFLCAALASTMVFAMAAPSFAAQEEGKITITNTIKGQTYQVYQILTAMQNADETSIAYVATDAWKAYLATDAAKEYLDTDTAGNVSWVGDKSDARVQAFAKAALAYAKEHRIAPTASTVPNVGAGEEGEVTFEVGLGYFLVDSSAGTLVTLDTNASNAIIKEKNEAPTVNKTITSIVAANGVAHDGNTLSASIGDTINYTIKITAQPGAQDYVLHDIMDSGLSLANVNDDDTVDASDITVSSTLFADSSKTYYEIDVTPADNHTFDIRFTDDFEAAITAETEIFITYSATLNSNAVIGEEGNNNKASLNYGEGGTTPETPESEDKVYTFDMPIYKYTATMSADGTQEVENTQEALSGAVFTLSASNEANAKPIIIEETDNGYKVAVNQSADVVAKNTQMTTGEEGTINIQGLSAGTYYLTEVTAPFGYNKLTAPIKVVISATEDVNNNGEQTVTMSMTQDDNAATTISVLNIAGSMLPSTGGIGTTIFYAAGIILMAGAVFFVVRRKRA